MYHPAKIYPQKLRPAIVLLLLVAFLLLSYCPLRRTIQALIKGIHQTEQTKASNGTQLTSKICLGFVNDTNEKLILAEPKSGNRAIAFEFIAVLIFYVISSFFAISREHRINGFFFRGLPVTIPLYLKNRVLLI